MQQKIKQVFTSIIFFLSAGAFAGENTQYTTVTTAQSAEMIHLNSDNEGFQLLDVRTIGEYQQRALADAINLDYYGSDFATKLAQLNKNKTYLVYCRSGVRSKKALKIMQNLGFSKLYDMGGGILQWQKEQRVTVKP